MANSSGLIDVNPEETVLLHSCCGPCLAWPSVWLRSRGQRFLAWFYNPNIHPAPEHARRQAAFLQLAATQGITALAESRAEPADWLAWSGTAAERCHMCYRRRLEAAAARTAGLGLSAFTTTLLISPYQDHALICASGAEAAARHGVRFLTEDWRPYFREGQQIARAAGLYRQKFCGCAISLATSRFREQIETELRGLAAQPESSDNDHK